MQYELFYLVGEKNETNIDAIREDVNKILAEEKATLIDQEVVEKRKLAYEIKHQHRGTYVTRRFDLPEVDYWADEANAEKEFGINAITKKLNLHPQVLRSMIVKADELPEMGAKEARQARELKEQKEEKAQPKKERPVAKKVEKKEATKEVVKEAPKKEEKEGDEAIDKKLEEILNI